MKYSAIEIRLALRDSAGRLFPEAHDSSLYRAVLQNPVLAPALAQLRRAAGEAAANPPEMAVYRLFADFERTGARRPFEGQVYFPKRGKLGAAALIYLLEGDESLRDVVHDYIWAICDEFSWSLPAHLPTGVEAVQRAPRPRHQHVDLFAAETALMLAEIDSLIGDRLDQQVRDRLRAEVTRRVLDPYFGNPHLFAWETARSNWAAVCAGSACGAALYLVDDPDRLAGMVYRAMAAMDSFLESYGDDGACAEGPGYWEYGFGFFTFFAELLWERTEGRIDLLDNPKVWRIADFPVSVRLAKEAVFSFSDSPLTFKTRAGLMCRLAERAGATPPPLGSIAAYDDDHCHRWAHLVRDLFWTRGEAKAQPLVAGSTYFKDVQWMAERHIDESGALFAWAAKGGHNAEPHNQNDVGHFILHVDGSTLLCDLGAGEYTRQYFRPETRYQHIHNGSQGHSVPEINGVRQAPGRHFSAGVLAAEKGYFALDLTRAYPDPTLRRFTRTFRWEGPSAGTAHLHLEDAFTFDGPPGSLQEVFISLFQPVVDGGTVRWGAGPRATLRFDPAQFTASVERVEAKSHLAAPQSIYRVVLSAANPAAAMTCRFHFTLER